MQLIGVEQNRKAKGKAPKPPSTTSTNAETNDNFVTAKGMKTKPQRLNKQEVQEPKTHKNAAENHQLLSKQQKENKVVSRGEPDMLRIMQNANESVQVDDRFSPEKDQALQTLDDVIQEVEKSLGKIRDFYYMGNWTRQVLIL